MKVAFVIIVLVWLFFGFMSLVNCDKDRVIWEGFVFYALVPFLPFIALFFGIS